MKPTEAKVYLSGIGILSLGFFFWLFLYQMFVSTNASARSVHASFERPREVSTAGKPLSLNIFLMSRPTESLSAATITVRYPADLLQYDSVLKELPDMSDAAQVRCAGTNYKLKTVLEVKDIPQKGMLTITRVDLAKNEDLPSGLTCFGTIVFKPLTTGQSGIVSFGDTDHWQFVGPQGSYQLVDEGRDSVRFDLQ